VKPLFRRAFIIGRRFRLVHVHIGPEPIEVSTFRAAQTGEDATDEHGRLISDNVYGTQAEDAARRDFTINALYFDPATEEVWDYVGGITDVASARLRLIGPPVTRLREDPGAHAARGAARGEARRRDRSADCRADSESRAVDAERSARAPLRRDAEALLSGHAVETMKSLRAHGLSHGLLPLIDIVLEQPLGQRFVELALADTDLRVREDRGVSPAFLFATLLWHEVLATWTASKAAGQKPIPALFDAMDEVLQKQAKKIAVPRRFEAAIKEIWSLQPRFEQRSGQRPFRLIEHARFRAGWDFLELRCRSGEFEGERAQLAEWWDRFAKAAPEAREAMLKPDTEPRKRPRARSRGRKRRPEGEIAPPAPNPDAPPE
jgi:poly(A) polymerase